MSRPLPAPPGRPATPPPAPPAHRLLRLWRRQPDGWTLALATLALALTLLRPPLPVREDLVHAVLVIDITQSMNVADGVWREHPVTRGELARRAAAELMREVPCGSELGLGIFNEYRTFVLLAPIEVCANFHELETTLDAIGNRMSWSGASEIAKGINSGLKAVRELPGKPAFVLFTDGHEAPPISLAHRPRIEVVPGELGGVLVGTGSLRPQPIPKYDPNGNRIGFWKADEVAQADIYSQGREGSVAGEADAPEAGGADAPAQARLPKPKPGQEHLSALHEAYLQELASETGLGYLRLGAPGQLHAALLANQGATRQTVPGDGRWPLALLALIAICASHAGWRAGPLLRAARERLRRRRPPRAGATV